MIKNPRRVKVSGDFFMYLKIPSYAWEFKKGEAVVVVTKWLSYPLAEKTLHGLQEILTKKAKNFMIKRRKVLIP